MKSSWMPPSEALNRQLNRQAEHAFHAAMQAEVMRRLGFHVGNIALLIAEQATSELTGMMQTCPIPNTAPWLVGLINLRGNLLPVFDLNMMLGLEKGPDKKRMLLILGQGDSAGGIVIDGFPVHITFTEGDRLQTLPPLPEAIRPFATSGFEKSGEIWFNFDHVGFFQSLVSKIPS